MTTRRPTDPLSLLLEERQIRERAREELFGNNYDTSRYQIRRKLGAGGQGAVYAAYDSVLDCEVALKQFHSHANHERSVRLRDQARTLARLRGRPHVVTIYDFFEQEGMAIVAMELIVGPNLHRWQSTASTLQELIAVYRQAGRGLLAAHELGISHGDFKPDNVLVDEFDVAKVTDFGSAPTAGSRQVGTRHYMAPEQLGGLPAEPASDQYSFCLSLQEALSGFDARTDSSGPETRLREVLRRGLMERPCDRHPSMADLLAELAEVVSSA